MSGSRIDYSHTSTQKRTRTRLFGHKPAKVRGSQRKTQKKSNSFLSALLCFSTVLFICFFIFLSVLHNTSFNPIVHDVVHDIDITGFLETNDDGNYLWYFINGLTFHDAYISYADVEYFIKSDAVTNEIGNVVNDYVNALAAGNLDYHITAGDIVNISRNIQPELQTLFDHEMTEEQYVYVAGAIDDLLDLSSLSISGLAEDFDIDITIPSFLMSSVLLWVVGIISAGFLITIFFLKRRNICNAIFSAGVPVALSGLIAFIIGFFLGTSIESLSNTIHRLLIHLDAPAHLILQYGIAFAAAGLLIIAVSFVLKFVLKKA